MIYVILVVRPNLGDMVMVGWSLQNVDCESLKKVCWVGFLHPAALYLLQPLAARLLTPPLPLSLVQQKKKAHHRATGAPPRYEG